MFGGNNNTNKVSDYNSSSANEDGKDVHNSPSFTITALRTALLSTILLCAVILGYLTFDYSNKYESNLIQLELDSAMHLFDKLVHQSISEKVNSGLEVALIFSNRFSSLQDWPNILLSGFELILQNTLFIAGANSIYFSPFIHYNDRSAFEKFANHSQGSMFGYKPGQVDWSIGNGMYKIVNGTKILVSANSNLSVPIFQSAPIQLTADSIFYDQYSNSFRAQLIDQMISTKNIVSSDLYHRSARDDLATTQPSTLVYVPITITMPQYKVVGCVTVDFNWEQMSAVTLPDYTNDLHLVLSERDLFHTYIVKNGLITYLGSGDLHVQLYERYKSAVTVQLPGNSNTYTIFIYPSTDFVQRYTTTRPLLQTITVVVALAITCAIFIVYDCYITAREETLKTTAKTASDIVEGLFPSFVRDRLFAQPQVQKGVSGSGKGNPFEKCDHSVHSVDDFERSTSLRFKPQQIATTSPMEKFLDSSRRTPSTRRFMGGNNNNNAETSSEPETNSGALLAAGANTNSAPITESFQSVTVLFADIAGFTKWSAGVQPGVVFDLLENLYGDFDKCARQRKVFKVETIGDCYMAVSGLPVVTTDHAESMCQFALDMLQCLERVQEQILGIDELKLRIGMHSGSVTAGVVRGDRARFQLFGETVRIASRMESTSIPGRIQLSEVTFKLLTGHRDLMFDIIKPYVIHKRDPENEDLFNLSNKPATTEPQPPTFWLEDPPTSSVSESYVMPPLQELQDASGKFEDSALN